MKPRKDKVLTGLAGEFYVLAQLAERGFTAALTLGNSKNVDIIVTSPNGKKITRLEVKTSSLPLRHEHLFGKDRFHIWAMGEKHERIKDKNLAYCFVVLKGKAGDQRVNQSNVPDAGPRRDSRAPWRRDELLQPDGPIDGLW